MDVTRLTMGRDGSPDLNSVLEDLHNEPQANIIVRSFESNEIEIAAKEVSALAHVSNLSHLEDCIAFWLISENVRNMNKIECIFSANGPDELFCGYDRFRRIVDSEGYESVEREILKALKIAEDLGSQVRKITTHFGLEIYEPLLDQSFRKAALEIPVQLKILRGNDLLRKRIWRCFGRSINVEDSIVLRPKKAMQYGMGIGAVVTRMLKQGSLRVDFKTKVSNTI